LLWVTGDELLVDLGKPCIGEELRGFVRIVEPDFEIIETIQQSSPERNQADKLGAQLHPEDRKK
jgi:hypothetical protein